MTFKRQVIQLLTVHIMTDSIIYPTYLMCNLTRTQNEWTP